MREWLARLRDWLRRDRLDRELAEELRFHQELLERDSGIGSRQERSSAARRRLGNITRIREEARDRWSWPWLDHFLKDTRYALRGLRRARGFTATVILTLGLGIGANAAMFSVVDRLMFRPLPFLREPDRVHRVYLQSNDRGRTRTRPAYEYSRYLDLRKFSSRFEQWAAFSNLTLAVGSGDASREVRVGTVSASFWDFFEARPVIGRLFGPAEDSTPMGAPVVVLSYDYWRTEFGGRNVLGQTLQVANIPCAIIGVLPAGFIGIPDRTPPALYLPITTYAGNMGGPDDRVTYYTRYHWGWLAAIVRRRAGVTEAEATADLSQAFEKSWEAARAVNDETRPTSVARPHAIAGPIKTAAGPDAGLEPKTLLWVTGVAGIVLLIACANVANLMFARVLRRRRETAVRLALGVSRSRLLAQALTESLVLAGLGGITGLLIAQAGGGALRRLFVPPGSEVLTDWRTVGVAGVAALLAAGLAGFAPALLATRADLANSLKAGAREGTMQRSRTRGVLLVIQGALSVLLLVGAGLFVQSLRHVRALRMGYDAEPVVMVTRNLRGMQLGDSERVILGRRLLEVAQSIPGVEKATLVSSVPFWSTSSRDLYVSGIDSVARLGQFTYQVASADYFATMDTRILRGRPFTAEDRGSGPRVAVVSEAMAEVLWPGKDALGQCIRVGSDTMPCTTVIGIAENAVQRNVLGDEKPYRYYLPLEQFEPTRPGYLLLKVRGDPASMLEPIRRSLQAVMPNPGYVTTRPLEEVIDGQRRAWKVGATMFVGFGILALLVAAVGLYGVVAYNVAQRTHEFGVRIALGARSPDVVRLVVGQGVRFALAGVTLGLGLALLVARWIQPLLYQQPAKDPELYGMVSLLLVAVAVVASTVPAVRATRADPNSALRAE